MNTRESIRDKLIAAAWVVDDAVGGVLTGKRFREAISLLDRSRNVEYQAKNVFLLGSFFLLVKACSGIGTGTSQVEKEGETGVTKRTTTPPVIDDNGGSTVDAPIVRTPTAHVEAKGGLYTPEQQTVVDEWTTRLLRQNEQWLHANVPGPGGRLWGEGVTFEVQSYFDNPDKPTVDKSEIVWKARTPDGKYASVDVNGRKVDMFTFPHPQGKPLYDIQIPEGGQIPGGNGPLPITIEGKIQDGIYKGKEYRLGGSALGLARFDKTNGVMLQIIGPVGKWVDVKEPEKKKEIEPQPGPDETIVLFDGGLGKYSTADNSVGSDNWRSYWIDTLKTPQSDGTREFNEWEKELRSTNTSVAHMKWINWINAWMAGDMNKKYFQTLLGIKEPNLRHLYEYWGITAEEKYLGSRQISQGDDTLYMQGFYEPIIIYQETERGPNANYLIPTQVTGEDGKTLKLKTPYFKWPGYPWPTENPLSESDLIDMRQVGVFAYGSSDWASDPEVRRLQEEVLEGYAGSISSSYSVSIDGLNMFFKKPDGNFMPVMSFGNKYEGNSANLHGDFVGGHDGQIGVEKGYSDGDALRSDNRTVTEYVNAAIVFNMAKNLTSDHPPQVFCSLQSLCMYADKIPNGWALFVPK